MGQAYDSDGNVLGEAFGETKHEVFKKLMDAHPDADSVEVHTMKPEKPASETTENVSKLARVTSLASSILMARNKGQKKRLKGELHDLVDCL